MKTINLDDHQLGVLNLVIEDKIDKLTSQLKLY